MKNMNGSMSSFGEEIRASLRDPASFEHIKYSATPVAADGWQLVRMECRAANGYGAKRVVTAEAQVGTKNAPPSVGVTCRPHDVLRVYPRASKIRAQDGIAFLLR